MTAFSWRIDARLDWPPRGRPHRPYGPTTVEIARSCPTRAAFAASPRYERRLGSAARVGLAMHSTLESLVSQPIAATALADIASEAQHRFDEMLEAQKAQAQARARERDQPFDLSRAEAAAEAVVAEAIRISRVGDWLSKPAPDPRSPVSIEVEVPVRSRDGMLGGVVDRAERDERGLHLTDYKSAGRDELPDRYRRQLQLYAYLWHETRDEWPTSGRVVYSAVGKAHPVDVEPEACLAVADEARHLLEAIEDVNTDPVAQPGEVCGVCEYRPWCAPFWQFVGAGGLVERLDRGGFGIEGTVTAVDDDAGDIRLSMDWAGTPLTFLLQGNRFAHARNLRRGDSVRLLDVRLRGLRSRPTLFVTAFTELFVVDGGLQ